MKTIYLKRIDNSDVAIIGVKINVKTLHESRSYIDPVAMVHAGWLDDLFEVDPVGIGHAWTKVTIARVKE